MKESTSDLLSGNCDEFIFYEDLERQAVTPTTPGPEAVDVPPEKKEVFDLMLESIGALIRENKDPIFASMVKDNHAAPRSPRSTSRRTVTAASATCSSTPKSGASSSCTATRRPAGLT